MNCVLRKLGTFVLFKLPVVLCGTYLLKLKVIYLKFKCLNKVLTELCLYMTKNIHNLNFRLSDWKFNFIFSLFSGYNMVENWVVNNHWDTDVTHAALRILTQISEHKQIYLIILITYCSLHVFNSILLILGSFLQKRLLLLPWLIQVLESLFWTLVTVDSQNPTYLIPEVQFNCNRLGIQTQYV